MSEVDTKKRWSCTFCETAYLKKNIGDIHSLQAESTKTWMARFNEYFVNHQFVRNLKPYVYD